MTRSMQRPQQVPAIGATESQVPTSNEREVVPSKRDRAIDRLMVAGAVVVLVIMAYLFWQALT